MAGETPITVIGNLTADPELRFTPSGAAVANFTVANTTRLFNKERNEWVDGDTTFWNCAAWRQLGENVAESLQRGTAVIVQGNVKSRSYEDKDGIKRTVFEIDVQSIGPNLRNATAKVTKAMRSQGGNGGGGWGGGSAPAGGEDPWASAPAAKPAGNQAADPWASPAPAGGTEEPPF